MYAVPDRLDARRRGDRPDHRGARWGKGRTGQSVARSLRYDDGRFALRAGRTYTVAGDERLKAFPRGFWSAALMAGEEQTCKQSTTRISELRRATPRSRLRSKSTDAKSRSQRGHR